MNDTAERMTLTFDPSAEDYARYAAAVDRRGRSWTAVNMYVVLLFSAIPVALLFRALAAQKVDDTDAIDMAGHFSLFAFVLGILASGIAASVITRIARRRYFVTTVAPHGPRTVELDRSGVTVTGDTSISKWQWRAVSRCTRERELLLIWVTPFAAVAIPCRTFESATALEQTQAFIRTQMSEVAAAASPPPPPRSGSA